MTEIPAQGWDDAELNNEAIAASFLPWGMVPLDLTLITAPYREALNPGRQAAKKVSKL